METEPMETEPMETEPMETEPMETEPMETEPMETEPVETEPMETEPGYPGPGPNYFLTLLDLKCVTRKQSAISLNWLKMADGRLLFHPCNLINTSNL